MSRKKATVVVSIIVLLGTMLGASIVLWSRTYTQLTDLRNAQINVNRLGNYRRNIEVESVNIEQRLITASTLDRDLGIRKFTFLVTDETDILKQDPIFEDGVVVGFTTVQTLDISDIVPGTHAFVRLMVSEDGSFIATAMSVGTPLARP